jgi:hypothetical protein
MCNGLALVELRQFLVKHFSNPLGLTLKRRESEAMPSENHELHPNRGTEKAQF